MTGARKEEKRIVRDARLCDIEEKRIVRVAFGDQNLVAESDEPRDAAGGGGGRPR